jgi:hypothetical protein
VEQLTSGEAKVIGGGNSQILSESRGAFAVQPIPGGIRVDSATNQLTGGVHQFTPAWAMKRDRTLGVQRGKGVGFALWKFLELR